jgi:hypothetical protein
MAQDSQTTPLNVDELRERLGKMSDAELRAFAQAAEHMVSPKAHLGQPHREMFVIQLDEARKEWNRRKSQPKITKPNEI